MNSLPKTVTQQRHSCYLNPGPTVPESSTLTTWLPSHPERETCIFFHQNVGRLFLFRKNIFLFSHVELFGYDKAQMRELSNFWRNFGKFPHLPKNRGMR